MKTPILEMNWINVKDRLPKDVPLLQPWLDPSPTYDWVPVASIDGRWSMARYAHRNLDKVLTESWEFFDKIDETSICADAGDMPGTMHVSEIAYWLDIWPSLGALGDEK